MEIEWNNYLFKEVLPRAWVKFLVELQPNKDVSHDYYKFWPIPNKTQIMSSSFFRDLLKNMICMICTLYKNDKVFYGSGKKLSISTGYFQDKSSDLATHNILDKIGFPVIYAPDEIIEIINELKSSDREIKSYSPLCISKFLRTNKVKLQDKLTNDEILKLLNYLLLIDSENYEMLEGLEIIPLANGKFNKIMKRKNDEVTYLFPHDINESDLCEILMECTDKLIAKDIPSELSNSLIELGKKQIFNIEVINAQAIISMVKKSLSDSDSIEIYMKKPLEWIIRLWKYLCDSDIDFTSYEDIHIVPTTENTLRKLKANSFLNRSVSVYKSLGPILKKLGIVFVDIEFENNLTLWKRISTYICDINDITSVLLSLKPNGTCHLDSKEADIFIGYLCNLRNMNPHFKDHEYWIDLVIPYLESQLSIDIVTVEKLVEQLPTLFKSVHSLKNKLKNIAFIPSGTIRMAQGKEDLDTIKCRPVDLFDPTNQEIVQLFFDDEKVFPVGKFSDACNQHYHILKKRLGMKTSLTQIDIVKRINKYVELRKKGNKIDSHDLRDKSLNLFRYIDKYWNSFEDMNDTEFLSLQWIPTTDKTGQEIFSCLRENGCHDKKNKDLVSLVVPILDYQVESPSLRDHLGWNTPPTNFILEQMHQCSTMSEDYLNFKNRLQICEAIYEHINKALSSDDEKCKSELSELSRGLKNKKWIFCEGNFYEAENVFFNLSENFGRDIVQLPNDYQNKFNKLFKYMDVRERIDINVLISIIEIIKDEANHSSLTESKLSEIIKLLEHIANERTSFKEEGQTCDLKDLLIPSTDSTLLRHEDIYFDDRPKLHKAAKNYKISHPKITLELAEKLGIQMLSSKFLNCSQIEFEALEHSVLSTTRIKNVINGCSLDLLFKEFLKNADDAGARNFSIYLDERILDKNSEKHSLLSREMHNWQGPTVWIYYDKKVDENDFLIIKTR